jgi:hypothetical protein
MANGSRQIGDSTVTVHRDGGTTMTPETERTQRILDEAFAKFKLENAEVAQTLEMLNVSFGEYVQMLSNLHSDPQTTSGNAQTTG